MPRGDWFSTAAFGLAVAALIGWGVYRASDLQREYSEDRQEIASKHSDRVEDSLRICRDIPGPLRAAECRSEAIAAAYGEESAQKDLKAQQHMSVWAFGMFIATLAALLVTLAGLVFVVRTWRETKRTADIAKEIGEAQVRAYLHCKSAKYKLSKDFISAIVEIENTGQSPANTITISGGVTLHEVGGFPHLSRVLAWVSSSDTSVHCQPIAANGSTTEEILFFWEMSFPTPDDESHWIRADHKFGNEIWFNLRIRWRDVFGRTHSIPIDLDGGIDAGPNYQGKKRSSSGNLHFRMDDPKYHDTEKK